MPSRGDDPEARAPAPAKDGETSLGEPLAIPPTPRRGQVSLRTVLTVGLGVLGLLAVIEGLTRSTFAISLTLAAVLLALALDHAVQVLVRHGVRRPIAIAIVVSMLLAFLVGVGYVLIPPAVAQGKELIGELPGFVRGIRRSPLFQRLDGYLNLSERLQDLEGGSGATSGRSASRGSPCGSVSPPSSTRVEAGPNCYTHTPSSTGAGSA